MPTETGMLSVANGEKNQILLEVGQITVPVDAAEGLRVAGWIKQEKDGSYAAGKSLAIARKDDLFSLTLNPPQGNAIHLRLKKDAAYLLGEALASARQNVSEAGRK